MQLLIIGAGGHGRVVLDAARVALAGGGAEPVPVAFVDRKPPAATVAELPVYDSLEAAFDGTGSPTFEALPSFIVAVGDNKQRAEEFDHACKFGLQPVTVIHPTAVISPSAHIGAGSYVGAQTVINPDAYIGEDAIINTAAIIEHDCHVGAHAFVAPGVVLCGAASIGDYTLVGAGAVLIPQVQVGARSLVAAGAVITRDYPDNARLFGVPAVPAQERSRD